MGNEMVHAMSNKRPAHDPSGGGGDGGGAATDPSHRRCPVSGRSPRVIALDRAD